MPHAPETTDPNQWSRFFAVETNNRAWELASQPERSAAEAREMLDAAHASAHHWNRVGSDLNRARAAYLVAEVHALLGLGTSAVTLASEARAYFQGRDVADWESAFIHAIHAHAAAAAGDAAAHAESYAAAETALAGIADAEDRRIVELTFVQVPKPGGA